MSDHREPEGRISNIVVSSVGGQGGLLATRVLAEVLAGEGRKVKTSEVHGMAQRGGSVLSFVRRGDGTFAPVIDRGGADAIIGLELLEAVRALPFLKPGGLVVASTQRVIPVPVLMGQCEYPEDLPGVLGQAAGRVVLVPAGRIAIELGNSRVANVVCLGALAACSGIEAGDWRQAISDAVPRRTLELNLEAFARGFAAGSQT